jgi:serine/threonine-protein kinase
MTQAPTDLIGRRLGTYRLERLLGQGGTSWVFAARHEDDTAAAVKVLMPRFAADAQIATRFRNESETASKLPHENIIRIRAVGEEGEHVYFVMDLCSDNLAARIARDGALAEADIVRVARDVVRGLGFAHAQGVIHRDLKPDNVLLRSDGSAVLSDFGIARAVLGYLSSTGVDMTIGTPQYLAPEQAQGRPLDPRTDFYALGVTLYKAATGAVPFASNNWYELARMHVEDPPPPPRAHRADLSKRFERIVLKCLAKHPDDRYPDAAGLLADLDQVDTGTAPTADIRPQPPRWRSVAIAVVLGILLVALVVLLR